MPRPGPKPRDGTRPTFPSRGPYQFLRARASLSANVPRRRIDPYPPAATELFRPHAREVEALLDPYNERTVPGEYGCSGAGYRTVHPALVTHMRSSRASGARSPVLRPRRRPLKPGCGERSGGVCGAAPPLCAAAWALSGRSDAARRCGGAFGLWQGRRGCGGRERLKRLDGPRVGASAGTVQGA